MRIISKFRDYYDSAQSLGTDPTRIYSRVTEEVLVNYRTLAVNLEDYPVYVSGSFPNKSLKNSIRPCYLFFCGKLYTTVNIGDILGYEDSKEFSSSWEDILPIFRKEVTEFSLPYLKRSSGLPTLQKLDSTDINSKVFEGLGCPVFLLFPNYSWQRDYKIRIIKNPRLGDLGFQHRVDPYTAFQSISTFLGNELCQNEEKSNPTNDELIHATGHCSRTSFRTGSPGAKKVRRRNNKRNKRS